MVILTLNTTWIKQSSGETDREREREGGREGGRERESTSNAGLTKRCKGRRGRVVLAIHYVFHVGVCCS